MEFRYTGADTANAIQNSIQESLGGFIASSLVPNNVLNNLFSDISKLGQERGYIETIALILKNTTGATVTTVELFYDYPTNELVTLEINPVTLINNESMERIPNFRATPLTGTFVEADGVGNKVLLATSLDDDEGIGIWFRRTINTPDLLDAIDCEDLEAFLAALVKVEDITMTVLWV